MPVISAGYNSLIVNVQRPYDDDGEPRDDLIGMRVWMSETSGFTPSLSNMVHDGPSLSVTVPDLVANKTYYVVYALISEIDQTHVDYSNEFSCRTMPPISGSVAANVYAYKRSSSTPTNNPGDVTYDFTTNTITSTLANGWSATIPSGASPLYVVIATATSYEATDTIAANEWSAPTKLTQDGLDGVNTATIAVYKRTTTSAAPAAITGSGTSTYTFATATLSSAPAGWTTTIPTTGGSYLWVCFATAVSSTATDSITDSKWSVPAPLAADGQAAKVLFMSSSAQIMKFKADGVTPSSAQTVTINAYLQNESGTVTFTATPYNDAGTAMTAITLGGTGNTGRTLTSAQWPSGAARVEIVGSLNGLSDSITVIRVETGDSAISGFLTNESVTFAAASDGSVSSYSTGAGNFKVYYGLTDKTASSTFAVSSETGCDVSINATTGAYTVVSMSADTASAVLSATYSGQTITKTLTLSKSRAGTNGAPGSPGNPGANGISGTAVKVTSDRALSFTATDGSLDASQSNIVFTANTVGLSSVSYAWTFSGLQSNPTASTTNSQTVTQANFGTSKSAIVKCTVTGNNEAGSSVSYSDSLTIVRLEKSTAAAGATVGAAWGTNISGQPTSLSGINSTEGSKLSGIQAGATAGATIGSNLSGSFPINSASYFNAYSISRSYFSTVNVVSMSASAVGGSILSTSFTVDSDVPSGTKAVLLFYCNVFNGDTANAKAFTLHLSSSGGSMGYVNDLNLYVNNAVTIQSNGPYRDIAIASNKIGSVSGGNTISASIRYSTSSSGTNLTAFTASIILLVFKA